MTTGIYKLIFAPGVEYIGKANDIEDRWDEHASSFLRNKASAKMMAAFKQYGYPDGKILITCHKDHIDFMECYYIDRERPILNTQMGFSISDEDFEIVQKMITMLAYSTVEHLRILDQMGTTIESLEDAVADAEYKAALLQHEFDEKRESLQAVIDLKDKERRFKNTLEDREVVIRGLQLQLLQAQKPWYKKLIG